MLTLEVYLSSNCLSAPAAKTVAEQAVKKIEQVHLVFRDEEKDHDRAASIGLFIFPAFVIGTEILTIGLPSLEDLVLMLKNKL